MIKFKIGDRICVYGPTADNSGVLKGCIMDRDEGEVQFWSDWSIGYKSDSTTCIHYVNLKQCRKLVKKERRECWLWESKSNGDISKEHVLLTDPQNKCCTDGKWVKFREVK